MSTNSTNTFIAISPDSKVQRGIVPDKAGTIATLQYELIQKEPYCYTSDDVLFLTHARKHSIPAGEWPEARREFFSKSKACLRTSPLVKQFGWGVHHDGEGKVALYGAETERYKNLVELTDIKVVVGMRMSRATKSSH